MSRASEVMASYFFVNGQAVIKDRLKCGRYCYLLSLIGIKARRLIYCLVPFICPSAVVWMPARLPLDRGSGIETDDGVLEIQKVGARHSIRPRSDMDKMGQSLIAIGLADTFESKRLDQLAAQHLAKAVKDTTV